MDVCIDHHWFVQKVQLLFTHTALPPFFQEGSLTIQEGSPTVLRAYSPAPLLLPHAAFNIGLPHLGLAGETTMKWDITLDNSPFIVQALRVAQSVFPFLRDLG